MRAREQKFSIMQYFDIRPRIVVTKSGAKSGHVCGRESCVA